jgi:hypothetical protein
MSTALRRQLRSMGFERERATVSRWAPAGERRQAAQDEVGVGDRLPADLIERVRHRAGAMGRQQQALDLVRRIVTRRGLLRKDVCRRAEPPSRDLPQELWKIDR